MSLRLRNMIAVISLLLAVGVVEAAFEFDTTCTTCPQEGDVGPFIELGFSAYALTSADDFPSDLRDQALLDRFEVLQAENKAVLLRASRLTASQGRIVEFTIDRPSGAAGDGYPEMKAALAPMVLDDGSIQVGVQMSMTGESGTVTGPQGEAVPITWTEQLQTAPVISSGGVTGVAVAVRLGPNARPVSERAELTLALLVSPTVIGDVPAPAAAAQAPRLQLEARSVEVSDGEAVDAALAAADFDGDAWVTWLRQAVVAGTATVINYPRVALTSGAETSVAIYSAAEPGATDTEPATSEVSLTAEVLDDGRVRMRGSMGSADWAVTLHQGGEQARPLPVQRLMSLDVTTRDGEMVVLDLSQFGACPAGKRVLMLMRAHVLK